MLHHILHGVLHYLPVFVWFFFVPAGWILAAMFVIQRDNARKNLKWQKQSGIALEHALECSRNMWRDDYNSLKKLQGLTESALNAWIKNYNLLAEENICLIRSVKEAQQETALEKVQAKYWRNDSDKWHQSWFTLMDETKDYRAEKARKETEDLVKELESDLFGDEYPEVQDLRKVRAKRKVHEIAQPTRKKRKA